MSLSQKGGYWWLEKNKSFRGLLAIDFNQIHSYIGPRSNLVLNWFCSTPELVIARLLVCGLACCLQMRHLYHQ